MAYTPYVKTNFADLPSEDTPIDADTMNKIEDGILELENNSIFYEEIGEINEETGEITYYTNN